MIGYVVFDSHQQQGCASHCIFELCRVSSHLSVPKSRKIGFQSQFSFELWAARFLRIHQAVKQLEAAQR
jgi:hypothetical protein